MKPSISILTHSALPLAKQCIQSVIENSASHEYELILTANGNPEAAAYFVGIAKKYPDRVQVVINQHNQGFIEPNKHALQLARGTHFIMLNDDATVPPGWLDKLEAPFLANPKCAISGAAGGPSSLNNDFIGFRGQRFEYVEGSCLCVLTDLARQHGLFSSYLEFAYAEDADLCLRMRELGYTIHQADFRLASHATAATSATVPGLQKYMLANFEACRRRWAGYLKTRSFA